MTDHQETYKHHASQAARAKQVGAMRDKKMKWTEIAREIDASVTTVKKLAKLNEVIKQGGTVCEETPSIRRAISLLEKSGYKVIPPANA